MATTSPDLSVVIPMHDASATVVRVVQSFLALDGIGVEVVLVDDASSDNSVARVEALGRPEVRVVRLATNAGAGVARNAGFPHATGRYTLFFDADDEVVPATVEAAVAALDRTDADVALASYRYRRPQGGRDQMNSYDLEVWSRYVDGPQRTVTLEEAPMLLGFSNYPWNKVVRTERFRELGLRFGSTRVHNDILGHWMTLLDARQIVLLDDPLCIHVVTEGGRNLTNQMSRSRLALFQALDETYTLLESRPAMRNRYSHHYWGFVLRVADWASGQLSPEVSLEFNSRLQEHLLRMDLADFTRMRQRRAPALATRIVRRALI